MATKQSKPTKQTQASKRLLKKISALRATLPADERKVLDSLIVTEVQAHRLALKKPAARAAVKKPSTRKTMDGNKAAMEVEAHGLKARLATDKNHAQEVEAHLLKERAVQSKASVSKYDSEEVSAHKFTRRAALSKHSDKAAADEVRAHIAKSKAAEQKTSNMKAIHFDKAAQEYKLEG